MILNLLAEFRFIRQLPHVYLDTVPRCDCGQFIVQNLSKVVIAYRWRADPVEEMRFFKSFDNEFDREEVGLE